MVLLAPGHELRVVMALRGKRGRDVAARAGLSEWQLSRILSGKRDPDPDELDRIRRAIFEPPG